MSHKLVVDEEAAEEAEAQARYYAERAGEVVSLRFVAEIEAIYRGLAEGHFVGVNHQRVRFRLPIKRVFLDRFPFAVVFYVENDVVTLSLSRRSRSGRVIGARVYGRIENSRQPL